MESIGTIGRPIEQHPVNREILTQSSEQTGLFQTIRSKCAWIWKTTILSLGVALDSCYSFLKRVIQAARNVLFPDRSHNDRIRAGATNINLEDRPETPPDELLHGTTPVYSGYFDKLFKEGSKKDSSFKPIRGVSQGSNSSSIDLPFGEEDIVNQELQEEDP